MNIEIQVLLISNTTIKNRINKQIKKKRGDEEEDGRNDDKVGKKDRDSEITREISRWRSRGREVTRWRRKGMT